MTGSDFFQAELTPELAGATLDYFVSCGDRLSQMTKTYHDIDAVTRLLQEKEKDLELAAKIGQASRGVQIPNLIVLTKFQRRI